MIDDYFIEVQELSLDFKGDELKNKLLEVYSKVILKSESYKTDSNYYHLLGHIKYYCNSPEEAVSFLRKSIEIDGNNFAKYKLGFVYYDLGKYRESHTVFSNISLSYFKEIEQLWRVFKIKELLLCCEINGQLYTSFDEINQKIETLFRDFINHIESGSYDYSFPGDIVFPLYKILKTDNKKASLLKASFLLIDSIFVKFELWEAYQKEFLFFKSLDLIS